MKPLLCIGGPAGSGKTSAADYLATKGWKYIRFGQITLDTMQKQGLEVSEENEKNAREQIRSEHGKNAYAKLNIPKIKKYIQTDPVVADGIQTKEDLETIKEVFPNTRYVVLSAESSTRYHRLKNRISPPNDAEKRFRPLSEEDAKKRDVAEKKYQGTFNPGDAADYVITNNGSKEELFFKIEEIIKDLEKNEEST